MDHPRRPTGRPGGGSVRRAREMLDTGEVSDISLPIQAPPRRRPDGQRAPAGAPSLRPVDRPPTNTLPLRPIMRPTNLPPSRPSDRPTNVQPRPRQPMPPTLSAPRDGGMPGIGVAISRPSPVPQWPLPAPIQSNQPMTKTTQPSSRAPPPERPPRSRNVPTMLDGSKIQEPGPLFQLRPQRNSGGTPDSREAETDPSSSTLKTPNTPVSRPTTNSSVGSIPDFPLPTPGSNASARKSANLGPPPSSRRGASSYYSNFSYVSPIPEEKSPQGHPSHGSYASSTVMPTYWKDDTSDNYDDDDVPVERNPFAEATIIEEGHESRQSNVDDSGEPNLVRSASIGRRGRPLVVTTKGVDKLSADKVPSPVMSEKLQKMGVFESMDTWADEMRAAAVSHAEASGLRPNPRPVQPPQRDPTWPTSVSTDARLVSGTGYIDSSSSDTASTLRPSKSGKSEEAQPPMPADPRISQIISAHNAASNVQPFEFEDKEIEGGYSRLSAMRRPPRLDINAVRDAEVRGSLTSLPDLIRRATKLAAMIDKGKRPGSRLNNLNNFDNFNAGEKDEGGRLRGSSLSNMLAAFPPPGLTTPRGDSDSRWPSPPNTHPIASRGGSPPAKARRCCGLPPRIFLLVVLVTILIIAAAILVPLLLLVLNKSPQPTPDHCQSTTTCLHGGTISNATIPCSCVCQGGFTGSNCSMAVPSGCISYTNVTIGEAIPRLFLQAQMNFSIPLVPKIVVDRFAMGGLACDTENALVTFDVVNKRLGLPLSPAASNKIITTASVVRRSDIPFSTSTSIHTITTTSTTVVINPSIIVDTSAFTTPSTSATTSLSTQPTFTSTAATSTSSVFVITEETLDFARVAVLYIVQQQSLDNAVAAQQDIQEFFHSANAQASAGSLGVENGNVIDFNGFRVIVGGVSIGGKSGSGGSKREVVEKRMLEERRAEEKELDIMSRRGSGSRAMRWVGRRRNGRGDGTSPPPVGG